MGEWKYGDILRRAVTMKPLQYQFIMYAGPANRREQFVGVQITDVDALYSTPGSIYFDPPKVGEIRPALRRDLFELAPEEER